MIRFILRTYATPMNLALAGLVIATIGFGIGMSITCCR